MPTTSRWVILSIVVIAFTQTHLQRMAFAPLIPTFVADLDLSYAAAGTLQTAYFWTYTLAQIPIGVIADRWGVRRVMLTCMGLLALGALAFAASTTYLASLGARLLVGLGSAAVWVPGMRLLSEWFPPNERGRATGLMSAGGGLGGTVGLIVVPWLAAPLGWRVAYGATVVPALVTVLLIATLLPPGKPAAGAAGTSPPSGDLRRVLATRAIWPINLAVLFCYGGYFSFVTYLPAFLVRDLGTSQAEAGLITSLVTGGTIASWPLAGVLSDRVGRRKPIYLISQALSLVVCVTFALVVPDSGVVAAWVLALAAGILIGGMILPFVAVVELFPPASAATAAGVTNAACFVGSMTLPVLLGWVVDVTGSFPAAFLLAGVAQALALAFGAFMEETGRARSAA